MKLIVGLGNPGNRYKKSRHNAGFLAADHLIEAWKATPEKTAFQAELFRTQVGEEKVLLAKPQTFMNCSGESIGPLLKFFKLSTQDLLVIHDELDLDPLTFRIKVGGGTGGNNGLRSIEECLGHAMTDYVRFRIGIGKPATVGSPLPTEDYVLAPFSAIEWAELHDVFTAIRSAAELWILGQLSKAMNQFNQKKKLSNEGTDSDGI